MRDLPEEQQFARLVAEHLVFHRLKRGLSKLALAQKAGLDQRTITFIENGVNVPSLVTVFVICRAMGVKVATVVGNAAKGKPPAKREASGSVRKPKTTPPEVDPRRRTPRVSKKEAR